MVKFRSQVHNHSTKLSKIFQKKNVIVYVCTYSYISLSTSLVHYTVHFISYHFTLICENYYEFLDEMIMTRVDQLDTAEAHGATISKQSDCCVIITYSNNDA